MKGVDPTDFPQLRQVFNGYLHEDFLDEYGSAAEALKAFDEDADQDERARFRAEVTRFLDATKDLSDEDMNALLARLGSRWTPPTRAALVAALTGGATPRRRGSRRPPQE
jgi:hypothetical protein